MDGLLAAKGKGMVKICFFMDVTSIATLSSGSGGEEVIFSFLFIRTLSCKLEKTDRFIIYSIGFVGLKRI